jgi:hypothetical protein
MGGLSYGVVHVFNIRSTYWYGINRGASLDGGCIGDNFAELFYLGFEAWMSRPGAAIIKPVLDIDTPHEEDLNLCNEGGEKDVGPNYVTRDSVKKLGCRRVSTCKINAERPFRLLSTRCS